MLLLTSTSDRLELVTTTAAQLDVHATFIDTSGASIVPGRQNTQIATAATTIVVSPPGAATQRNVKTLHVRNKDATLSAPVLVLIEIPGVSITIFNVTLKPGEMFEMCDMLGLKVAHV